MSVQRTFGLGLASSVGRTRVKPCWVGIEFQSPGGSVADTGGSLGQWQPNLPSLYSPEILRNSAKIPNKVFSGHKVGGYLRIKTSKF